MYWSGTGSSRPYFAFNAAMTLAGSAFSRAHGPPGTACMRVNVISETAKRTGMIHRSRRMRYLVIVFLDRPGYAPCPLAGSCRDLGPAAPMALEGPGRGVGRGAPTHETARCRSS